MTEFEKYKEHIQCTHNAFCKVVIRHTAIDAARRVHKRREREISLDYLDAAEKRISELSAIFKRLYEDSVSGGISDERFTELSADYEAEQLDGKRHGKLRKQEIEIYYSFVGKVDLPE